MLQNVIPTPKKIEWKEGSVTLPLAIATDYEPWAEYVTLLREALEKLFETPIAEAEGGILLRFDEGCPKDHYVLDTTEGITLSAGDTDGILYAIATAIQTVQVTKEGITAPRAYVEDYPDKKYRSLLIDLAKEWHATYTINRYIDVCFMLKVKYLHLHFIDDERYTLPSRVMPRLNETCRSYTFEEIEAMRAYANERHRCYKSLLQRR